jgi:hypothetical protein
LLHARSVLSTSETPKLLSLPAMEQ